MTTHSDTSVEARAFQAALIQKKTPGERYDLMRNFSAVMLDFARRALRRNHPEWDPLVLKKSFIALHYGQEVIEEIFFQRKKIT